MHNIILSKKMVDDYVSVSDYLIGMGAMFFEQTGKERGCPEYVVWVLEGNGIGRNFYTRNDYHPDGKEKIFKRWNQREIRYIKG